ncbi:MAG: hypothetical protein K2H12_10400, partial [Acetatifactor sp.]|nr:hypothetical protein [Acetatifactor sp.]
LRLRRERQTLYERHPQYLNRDPYYPEPLCMELGDAHIYENYLDIRTDPQTISRLRWQAECPEQEPENLICEVQLSRAIGRRASKLQDSLCLQGYVVVKWENNACYERWLLLREQRETAGAHMVRLEMKYSGEAEYGMQEQPNVAMCGFRVLPERGVLPDGSYRIGMQARSRIGRRRLTVWTEQWVQVRNGIFEAVEELDTDSRAERNA